MKGLLKLAVVSGLGYFAVKGWRDWMGSPAAEDDRGPAGSSGIIRDAGPQAGDTEWDKVDEQVDESFSASDPPASY